MEFKDYVPTRVLHDFVGRIQPLGINYMLTGSMAMIRYTVCRQTADVDFVIELESDNKRKFVDALLPDYYASLDSVTNAINARRMFNVIRIETTFKIDCFLRKTTEFQKSAFERREKTDYYPAKFL